MKIQQLSIGMRVRRAFVLNPNMKDIPQVGDVGTVASLPETTNDTLVGVWWDGFKNGHCNDLFGEHKDRLDGWFVNLADLLVLE